MITTTTSKAEEVAAFSEEGLAVAGEETSVVMAEVPAENVDNASNYFFIDKHS